MCYSTSVKNPHAVALGKLGGVKGGHARARALSSDQRRAIARAAASARWTGELPDMLRPLFWQYTFEDLRLPRDKNLVMLHVLTYGTSDHVRWLRRRFGDTGIRRWIVSREGRGLSSVQMAPWVPAATIRRWQAADANAALWETR